MFKTNCTNMERIVWILTTAVVLVTSLELSTGPMGKVVKLMPSDNINGGWSTVSELVTMITMFDSTVRPIQDQSEVIRVDLTFHLNAIIDFSIANQKMDVMGYFIVEWMDEIRVWLPSEFESTNTAIIPKPLMWYPRLVIDKTYGSSGIVGDTTDMLKVSSNGTVKWAPNGIYSLVCRINTMFYPFDIQTCDMDIYVSDHTSSQVALFSKDNGGVFLKEFTENVEWKLIDITSFTHEKYGTQFVTIRLLVERRASFTVYTMIIPLFALSLLCVTSYLVPIQSGEKISLTITIFLTYGFFVAVTRDSLPPDSTTTPHIVRYISAMMIISMLSVIYVVIESKIFASWGSKTCRLYHPEEGSLKGVKAKISGLHVRLRKVVNAKPKKNAKTNGKSTPITIIDLHQNEREEKKLYDKAKTEADRYTYEDFLSHADAAMFVANCVVLLILNAVIWGLVTARHEI